MRTRHCLSWKRGQTGRTTGRKKFGKEDLVWVWAYKCSRDSSAQRTEANQSQTGLSVCEAGQEIGHQLLRVSITKCCSLNCTHGCFSRMCDFLNGKQRFLFFCNRWHNRRRGTSWAENNVTRVIWYRCKVRTFLLTLSTSHYHSGLPAVRWLKTQQTSQLGVSILKTNQISFASTFIILQVVFNCE